MIFEGDRQARVSRDGETLLLGVDPYFLESADMWVSPGVRSTDTDLPTGVMVGRDSQGARVLSMLVDVATDEDWRAVEAFFASTGAGAEHELAWSFRGEEWMHYGRVRGCEPNLDEMGFFAGLTCQFTASDPQRYRAEPVVVTDDNTTILTDGLLPTRSWKLELPGPFTGFEFTYLTPDGGSGAAHKLVYPVAVTSGRSLVIDAHLGPVGGAYILPTGQTAPVPGDFVSGLLEEGDGSSPARILPWIPGNVPVIVTTTSGSAVATFTYRAAG